MDTNSVSKKGKIVSGKNCPYMDTIERKALDFDFEKVCSVSLTRQNVYACLVCGIYFNGRSKNTNAYFHSIHQDHHLYIHLETGSVYCLPDDYCVEDPSLSDIKNVLNPKYTAEESEEAISMEKYSSSLEGITFIPGRIGINNLGKTDSINSVLQSLFSIPPIVKFFMFEKNYSDKQSKLLSSFGELIRKFFNPQNFKGQMSPQEFLFIVNEESKGRFKNGKSSNPFEFTTWLLNRLDSELRAGSKKRTIISKVFKGKLHCEIVKGKSGEIQEEKNKIIPFMCLSLDLPPTPLYRGEDVDIFIPQVPITELLKKFDGSKTVEVDGVVKRYTIRTLPSFLIVHIKRYIKNDFRPEKNPTILNFPIKNLQLNSLLKKSSNRELKSKNKADLIKLIKSKKLLPLDKTIMDKTKEKLVFAIRRAESKIDKQYDLVANILHEGELKNEGTNKAFVYHRANNKWYETQDLSIQETIPQLVTVSESYVQIWECKSANMH